MIAFADANGQQPLGQAVDAVVKLAIGPAQVAVGIHNELVVRCGARPELELLAKGQRGEAIGIRADGLVGGVGGAVGHDAVPKRLAAQAGA